MAVKSANILVNGVQIPLIVDDGTTVADVLASALPRVMVGIAYDPADWELRDANDTAMAPTDDLTAMDDGGNLSLVYIG